PGQVEVGIAGYGNEQRIDIGGDKLGWSLALARPLQQRPPVQAAMQEPSEGIYENPVPNRKFCCVGARGQVNLDLPGTRKAGQSPAMDCVDPQAPKLCLGVGKLIFEKAIPAQLPHVASEFFRRVNHQALNHWRNI
ncbi:MAG TPA: hypothetical protein VLZ53_05660, partial [Devosia sp.]|nr:hypothetical protein [Devosia sp.]